MSLQAVYAEIFSDVKCGSVDKHGQKYRESNINLESLKLPWASIPIYKRTPIEAVDKRIIQGVLHKGLVARQRPYLADLQAYVLDLKMPFMKP